jgi:hypothetical protein
MEVIQEYLCPQAMFFLHLASLITSTGEDDFLPLCVSSWLRALSGGVRGLVAPVLTVLPSPTSIPGRQAQIVLPHFRNDITCVEAIGSLIKLVTLARSSCKAKMLERERTGLSIAITSLLQILGQRGGCAALSCACVFACMFVRTLSSTDISPLAQNNSGLIWENAPKFGALIVFAEHRCG